MTKLQYFLKMSLFNTYEKSIIYLYIKSLLMKKICSISRKNIKKYINIDIK